MRNSKFAIRRLHRAGACVRVTIPVRMSKALGLAEGDSVYVYIVGSVLCMKRFDEGGFTPDVVQVRRSALDLSQEEG